MKALLYKEFKLAMHPLCYIFIFLFPLMILIPSYPIAVSFIYILSCYPVLFLGANKGQQSNDLLYSTLLPVRKKDIVLARIITVLVMQFVAMAVMSCLCPVAMLIHHNSGATATGLPISGFVSILAIAIIGYAIADLIFMPIYYKHGKSIVASTLLTILGFVVYLAIFTVGIPYAPGGDAYVKVLCNSGLGIQFGFLAGALAISAILHIVVYKVASKRLEKVDF